MPKHNHKSGDDDTHGNNETIMSLYTPLLEPELAEKHSEEVPTELHHARKRTAHLALVRAIFQPYLAEEA